MTNSILFAMIRLEYKRWSKTRKKRKITKDFLDNGKENIMDLITNIQKYSIHDGDGIRTTVFFKGCPLKCVWCHNPETQRYEKEIQYDKEKCTGCGACAKVCPNSAITMVEGKPKLDKKLCTLCGKCENFCLQGIREMVVSYTALPTLPG